MVRFTAIPVFMLLPLFTSCCVWFSAIIILLLYFRRSRLQKEGNASPKPQDLIASKLNRPLRIDKRDIEEAMAKMDALERGQLQDAMLLNAPRCFYEGEHTGDVIHECQPHYTGIRLKDGTRLVTGEWYPCCEGHAEKARAEGVAVRKFEE